MATIECDNKQLRLIQSALELYSRIAILQFHHIIDYHPNIEEMIVKQFREDRPLKVGDDTERGVITKITKKYIWTKGTWFTKVETKRWEDKDNIKLSRDWNKYNKCKADINKLFGQIKVLITGDSNFTEHISHSIHNSNFGDSQLYAYDIIQVIRNEFYKARKDKSYGIDSHVTIWKQGVKVIIDKEEKE